MSNKYIIRDLECSDCGTEALDQMVIGESLPVLHPCAKCKQDTEHGDLGTNSGGGVRYRYQDFSEDPRAYRGQVKAHSPMATVEGEDSKDLNGNAIHDREQFGEDARSERREKIYHKTDKERGHTPMTFDQKSKGEKSDG